MKVILYRITLAEPLLVTALDGDPNSSETLHYIPGSVLRGALLAAYMRQKKLIEMDAADEQTRSLFFNGETSFLNGYPVVNNRRSLPAPLSWRKEKGAEEDKAAVYDTLFTSLDADKQWKGLTAPTFVTLDGKTAYALNIRLNVAIHTARNRQFGRPRGNNNSTTSAIADGAVYRYVSLAAGQVFEAAILCSDASEATLKPLITGELWLGGSRTAGYGRVKLEAFEVQNPLLWRESSPRQPFEYANADEGEEETEYPASSTGFVTITLLSDALLRGECGQWAADAKTIGGALSQAAGLSLQPIEDQCYLRATLVGGFNRKWGLPLPQAQAVQMGSVLAVKHPTSPEEAQALRRLEQTGIGERRAEGFGRIAVNWVQKDQWGLSSPTNELPQPVTFSPGSHAEATAQRFTNRMLQARLETALISNAVNFAKPFSGIAPSQINRLIEAFQNARGQQPEQGRAELKRLLGGLNTHLFNQYTIDGTRLLDWMHKRIDDQSEIWTLLNISDLPKIGSVTASTDAAQAYDFNLRLVIAVLARAVKLAPQN